MENFEGPRGQSSGGEQPINWEAMAQELPEWADEMELQPDYEDEAAEAAIFEPENQEIEKDQKEELEVDLENVEQEVEDTERDEVFQNILGEMSEDTKRLEETRQEIEDMKTSMEEIETLRQELGVTSENLEEEAMMGELIYRQEMLMARLKSLEAKLLGVEEDREEGEQREEQFESDPGRYESTYDGLLEAEERELRRKFVENYLQGEIEKIEKDEYVDLSIIENQDETRRLMATKVRDSIYENSKWFIEHGGTPEFGYDLHLEVETFQDIWGEDKERVTSVKVYGGKAWERVGA